jgi:hypothetical protein
VNPSTFSAGDDDRSCVVIGGFYLTITTAGKVATYCYGKENAGYHYSGTTLPLNTWSHLTAVWNEEAKEHKLYINGQCEFTIPNCYGVMSSDWHQRKYIGRELWWAENHDNLYHRPFTGKISDVRIYAFALSEKEILNLYKVSASLKQDGTLCAYEFKETDTVGISKDGTVSSAGGFGTHTTPTYDMKIRALPDRTTWARIHHLDVTNDKTFFTYDEVTRCTDKNNRYSRMGVVDKFFKTLPEYEFMLTYPSMSKSVPTGYTSLEYIETTSEGGQYIRTGVYGYADGSSIKGHRWEFDIEFANTTARQLMGYGPYGGEYWGIAASGTYEGLTVRNGQRDTIVHDYSNGTTGENILWVQNQQCRVGTNLTTSQEYILFCLSGTGGTSYWCYNTRLYRCKCVQENTLIRDFVPVMRDSDGHVGLYDMVNEVFYDNSGSGGFMAGPKGRYKYWKDSYQLLEYIESTGTQFIDTGVIGKTGISVEIDWAFTEAISGVLSVIGSSDGVTGVYPVIHLDNWLFAYHTQLY